MNVYTLFLFIGIAGVILTALRYIVKKPNNLLLAYLQNFLGSLFIFSGVVKAIDPLGTSYKMKEYFEAFSQDGLAALWEKLAHFSTEMAVFMIVLEIVLGIALIIGWREKLTVTLLFWMNLFFLFLTGYTYLSGFCISKMFLIFTGILFLLAAISPIPDSVKTRKYLIFSSFIILAVIFAICWMSPICFLCEFNKAKMKVTDCGCFGDFMKLKPWETFYKDVVLTGITFLVVYWRNKIQPLLGKNIRMSIVISGLILSLLFCLKNFVWGLPVVDFRPYAVGNDINEQMITPRRDSIEMIFIYKNKQTGVQSEFGMSNIPTNPIWEYVDRKDKIIVEGIPAKINNLMIEGDEGANITTNMINDPETTYWIVAWNLKETEMSAWKKQLKPFVEDAKKNGKKVYALTNMHDKKFEQEVNLNIPFYLADATPLKTMIRSNPGLMEIKKGVVKAQWHWRAIPEKIGQ